MNKHIKITLTYIHSILSLLLAVCCIGWIVLIGEGAYVNGHIPTYGDIETISLDGWDRAFVGYSLTVMFFGGFFLLTLILLNKRLKWIKFNKTIIVIGLISLIVNTLILFSPCLTWVLD